MKPIELGSFFASAAVYVAGTLPFTILNEKSDILPQANDLSDHYILWGTYLCSTGLPSFLMGCWVGEGLDKAFNDKHGAVSRIYRDNDYADASFHGIGVGFCLAAVLATCTALQNIDDLPSTIDTQSTYNHLIDLKIK